jgi:hypothetical protein
MNIAIKNINKIKINVAINYNKHTMMNNTIREESTIIVPISMLLTTSGIQARLTHLTPSRSSLTRLSL